MSVIRSQQEIVPNGDLCMWRYSREVATTTKTAAAEIRKIASQFHLTAAEAQDFIDMGIAPAQVKTILATLAPLFAARDASKPGSPEETAAVRAIMKASSELMKPNDTRPRSGQRKTGA